MILIFEFCLIDIVSPEKRPKTSETEQPSSKFVLPPVIDCKTIQTVRNCYDKQRLFLGRKLQQF